MFMSNKFEDILTMEKDSPNSIFLQKNHTYFEFDNSVDREKSTSIIKIINDILFNKLTMLDYSLTCSFCFSK